MKKALLIDVVAKTISEIQIGDYQDIYKHIGNGCNLFQIPIEFENGDCIFVDEEGLLKEVQGCFMMQGWSYPLCGNGVILGQDEEGDSADCKTELDAIKKQIFFGSKEYAEMWQEKALNTPPVIITWE